MSRFNLLDEAWIPVIYDEKGSSKEVSLKELFSNAHLYKDLAGDMKTQGFATLRFLLAILHTVYSRVNAEGEPYEYLELDEKMRQLAPVDEQNLLGYREELYKTWNNLWESKAFSSVIQDYLERWRERFYLLDEEYPFYQVLKEDIAADKINLKKAGLVYGKNLNRTISESNNKVALFYPK